MKIKQIESILKQDKAIIVAETPSCQWLGNGDALYPVYNLPKLTKENIFTLFDIAEDKREKFYFKELELPIPLNLEDNDDTEVLIERDTMSIIARGRVLEPLKTSQGMAFINQRYLKPFANEENGYELYERTNNHGRTYIAVKGGFMLLGIIGTYDLVDDNFISTIKSWLELSRVTMLNKAQEKGENIDSQLHLYNEEKAADE